MAENVFGTPAAQQIDAGADINGLLAWAYDPAYAAATAVAPTSGQVNLSKIAIPYTMKVSNIVLALQGAGTNLTAGQCWTALMGSDGSILGGPVDISTIMGTLGTGTKVISLGSAINLSGGIGKFVWVAQVYNNSSGSNPGLPKLAPVTNNILNANLSASQYRAAINGTGKTAIVAITPSSNTISGVMLWAGLS